MSSKLIKQKDYPSKVIHLKVFKPSSCQHLPYLKLIKMLEVFGSFSTINTSPALIYRENNLKELTLWYCSTAVKRNLH